MGIEPIFDSETWSRVPFHFWSVVFFVFGSMVGSFLNVCIYRMPIGLSVISPPSHCPKCEYSIPWYLNMPLVTWVLLLGKCKNCRAPISVRYFLVELLTGILFLGCWLMYGKISPWLALTFAVMMAGMVVATFIDFEHYIIPDEITIGGTVFGLVLSLFCPILHNQTGMLKSLGLGIAGAAVGWGLVYGVVRLGKLMFGKERREWPTGARIVFSETGVHLPDGDVPFEELFYRNSDEIVLQAQTVELIDRCYANVDVRLSPKRLLIGGDELDPEKVPYVEAVSAAIVLPREAMGFGDVKFMAAIGAFLGWQATIFSLVISSVLGSAVGIIGMTMRGRERFARIPYGPYIAAAAAIWIFLPEARREELRDLLSALNFFALF